jgi:para-aminobenzoate synthetase/4-amino-4-deoxychorismate lyase
MTLQPPLGPFVLCEDARETSGANARLFASPNEVIVARNENEIASALEAIRNGLKRGFHAAGWIGYEAGRAFEPRLRKRASRRDGHRFPLLWFGLFANVERVSRAQLEADFPDPNGAWISHPRPRITRARYDEAFGRAKTYIENGDIYQLNLSYRADVSVLGAPLAAYAKLRTAGGGGWSGVAHDGEAWLLSTSPELFFKIDADRTIEARPMKGTARRGDDAASDRAAAQALQGDPKERAENVMIVDLLRNDLSRIAKRGSVQVPALFTVETYPTLHTLTSTVRAEIREEHDVVDVLSALFPCGSITGAPKIRAMEIIDELESDTRGPYTGSIGWIAPNGEAEFNVAIRTLALRADGAEIGLGSAVVHDSTAAGEWEECRTKGAFLTAATPVLHLIETMCFDPGVGIALLDYHMDRLREAARAFDFEFDETLVRRSIEMQVSALEERRAVRLTLGADGAPSIGVSALPSFSEGTPTVALAPRPVAVSDFRLRYKTSLRGFYDDARHATRAQEVVFFDADGFLTEGSIANLFVERHGILITPPASRGLLPGVLRASLLGSGQAREGDLRAEDLGGGFFLGNAVRGLVAARLAVEAADAAWPDVIPTTGP